MIGGSVYAFGLGTLLVRGGFGRDPTENALQIMLHFKYWVKNVVITKQESMRDAVFCSPNMLYSEELLVFCVSGITYDVVELQHHTWCLANRWAAIDNRNVILGWTWSYWGLRLFWPAAEWKRRCRGLCNNVKWLVLLLPLKNGVLHSFWFVTRNKHHVLFWVTLLISLTEFVVCKSRQNMFDALWNRSITINGKLHVCNHWTIITSAIMLCW